MKKLTVAMKYVQLSARVNAITYAVGKVACAAMDRTLEGMAFSARSNNTLLEKLHKEEGVEGIYGSLEKSRVDVEIMEAAEIICAIVEESSDERKLTQGLFDKLNEQVVEPTMRRVWDGSLGFMGLMIQTFHDTIEGARMGYAHTQENADLTEAYMKAKLAKMEAVMGQRVIDEHFSEGECVPPSIKVVDATQMGDAISRLKEKLRAEGVEIVEPNKD